MGNLGTSELIALALVLLLVFVLPVWFFWRICAKAGYPATMALLMLGPLVLLGVLAFGDWPVHRRMREPGLPPPAP